MVVAFSLIVSLVMLRMTITARPIGGRIGPPPSRGVTVPAACADLGISSSLGYELIAKGEFPCRVIRAGRRLIVPRAELDRVLGDHTRQPDSNQASE